MLWSAVIILIGLVYLLFPLPVITNELAVAGLAAGPMVVCVAVATWKAYLFARRI